jgi:DNA-directed RNA polymerase subunit M/transcription elongation factor TFIIS
MTTSEIRNSSKEALSTVLNSEKNCSFFEKYIFTQTRDNPEIYTWCVYQIVGLLLQDISAMKKLANDVKTGKIGWKSCSYDIISSKIEEYDDYLVKPFEVVEGVVECGKCQSKKTWSVQKQTRSADEPSTTFSRCVECGHQWSYSG